MDTAFGAASPNMVHESNTVMNVEFRAYGNTVKLIVNGQVINYQEYDVAAGWAPVGSLITTVPTIFTKGHIGFQSEGDTVKFTDIHIIKIDSLDAAVPSLDAFPPNIQCLTKSSIVKVINDSGNKYVFNNLAYYNSNVKFGLSEGTYILTGIPSAHPLAILNNGQESLITYVGDDANKLTKSVTSTTADGTYDFYHGDITVTVTGDFSNVSVYCYYHGYMGGENLLTYSTTCAIPTF